MGDLWEKDHGIVTTGLGKLAGKELPPSMWLLRVNSDLLLSFPAAEGKDT